MNVQVACLLCARHSYDILSLVRSLSVSYATLSETCVFLSLGSRKLASTVHVLLHSGDFSNSNSKSNNYTNQPTSIVSPYQ